MDKKLLSLDEDPDEDKLYYMNIEENRIASFKDWPFNKGSSCPPKAMAKAGFYHIPTQREPDLVRCYVCQKEMDGWEPTDDPWAEHKSHAQKCPFVCMGKSEEEMTVQDFLKLEIERQMNRVTKAVEDKIKEFELHAADVRREMEKLA